MTRWSATTRTRRNCSALAYGSRSTAAAEKTSTSSYTTSGDATRSTGCIRHERPHRHSGTAVPHSRALCTGSIERSNSCARRCEWVHSLAIGLARASAAYLRNVGQFVICTVLVRAKAATPLVFPTGKSVKV
jgi:hypothetical protein